MKLSSSLKTWITHQKEAAVQLVVFIRAFLRVAIRVTLFVTILMVSIPPGYFIWRANQPMRLRQFDGMSYYQFVFERRRAYIELAQQYQVGHPGRRASYLHCLLPEIGVQVEPVVEYRSLAVRRLPTSS
jgi:hypothetical protein